MTRKKAPEPENHERWLVSYADFITLLFAFFVVMFASTQSDKNKAKAVSDSVRQALEHGQFSSAISTVLGRGRHESKKAPVTQEVPDDRENPNASAAAGAKPTAGPCEVARNLAEGVGFRAEERQTTTPPGPSRVDH